MTTVVNPKYSSDSVSENETLRDRIRSAKFVYLIGNPSRNGTTKADYSNFKHIDGDFLSRKDASSWECFFEDMVHQALEAALHSDNVVISHSCTRPQHQRQDFLVQKLIEAGACDENITVVRTGEAGVSSYRTKYCTWRPKNTSKQ